MPYMPDLNDPQIRALPISTLAVAWAVLSRASATAAVIGHAAETSRGGVSDESTSSAND